MKRIWGRIAAVALAVWVAAGVSGQYAHASSALPFNDIAGSYARNEIIDLYHRQIINGTSETSFSPAKPITRAEFIAVLDRLLKLEPVDGPITPYKDVAKSAWYYGWIQAAVQLELASGTSAATFAPAQPVTRQEAAVWLARALKQPESITAAQTAYTDSSAVAAWASSAVGAVSRLGLMRGDETGAFRPSDNITRQETALLMDRVLQQEAWSAELNDAPEERIVLGWQYGQTTAQYESTILGSNVNTLSPRWYFVGEAGAVSDFTDSTLAEWAKTNGKQLWPMVGNRSDLEATHRMLSVTAARNNAVNQLAALVSTYGLDGLNLDFENVGGADRTALTGFVTQLAAKLHTLGAVLSVDVSPDLGTDWTEAFDYAALGMKADYIVMMGYDEHYSGSLSPGSNASLPYVEHAVSTLLQNVSSRKVLLALPFFNHDWTLKQNGMSASSAPLTLTGQNGMVNRYGLRPVWDSSIGQYVASYSAGSLKHTIWLEEGRSLTAKFNLAAKHELAGIAYWHIGGESPEIWTSLSNAEKFAGYSF
ncbi:S-layer homology domain-containing protein [Paenibacillus tengchongensis]|uniref:S-layer homology domain-containing protein n=1 Tax=Paenibacillus tengchongensis TaxID=2608684 RepID=UPI00124E8F28|nr:S-layer homology domain-containing protein [Paenibacillus tengchongensis]